MTSYSIRSRHRAVALFTAVLGVLGLMTFGGVASAHSSKSSITVSKPWARTSPMEATNGAVYLAVKNADTEDNALVGASVPESVAMEVQLHETKMGSGGAMQMSQVSQITLGGKSTTKLEPGGYHIMLMELAEPLKTGSKIKVTLEFESGPKQTVKAVVKK